MGGSEKRLCWVQRWAGLLPDDVVDEHLWPRILDGRRDVLTAVSNLAAARFWCNLHDFAAAHRRQLPRQLVDPVVPADHPFLAWDGNVLRAQLPVDLAALA